MNPLIREIIFSTASVLMALIAGYELDAGLHGAALTTALLSLAALYWTKP